jgi:hypothetical protein
VIKKINNQPVASTHTDSQGESFTLETLQIIASSIPPRVPLNNNHDMTLPPCGEMTNFHIIQDPSSPGHHLLCCDVEYDDEKTLPDFKGFSWSALQPTHRNSEIPDFEIYLPYPLYNDKDLNHSILKSNANLVIGKFIKKAADPLTIALIALLLKPVWDTTYKQLLEDKVQILITSLKSKWPTSVPIDISFELPIDYYTPRPTVILCPNRSAGLFALLTTSNGVETALDYCAGDYTETGKLISRIRLNYDSTSSSYNVTTVEYASGETTSPSPIPQ